jgi:hypothetical protein
MIVSLRRDKYDETSDVHYRVFGPPLRKIDLLVESALASRRHEEGMPIL